jgi:hypothetical protein
MPRLRRFGCLARAILLERAADIFDFLKLALCIAPHIAFVSCVRSNRFAFAWHDVPPADDAEATGRLGLGSVDGIISVASDLEPLARV